MKTFHVIVETVSYMTIAVVAENALAARQEVMEGEYVKEQIVENDSSSSTVIRVQLPGTTEAL